MPYFPPPFDPFFTSRLDLVKYITNNSILSAKSGNSLAGVVLRMKNLEHITEKYMCSVILALAK